MVYYSQTVACIPVSLGKHGKHQGSAGSSMAILKRRNKDKKVVGYQVLIDRRDPVTGERKRVTVGTYPTKREAQNAEAKAITERERGTLLKPDTTTVGELLDEYLRVEVPRTVRPENR